MIRLDNECGQTEPDDRCWETDFTDNYATMYSACARLRLQHADICDVIQEAWLSHIVWITKNNVPRNPAALLNQRAEWKALDALRRRTETKSHETVFGDDLPDPSSSIDPSDRLELEAELNLLRTAIDRLSPDAQEIVCLKMIGDLSDTEIATALGLKSAEAVRMRFRRCKTKLAALMRGSIV